MTVKPKKLMSIILTTLLPLHGMAQQAIDVHCHNVLPEFTAFLESHGAALDEGYPLPAWDEASHLYFMDKAGIGLSVLSMPAPQPYFGNAAEARHAVRSYNEACARLKAARPGKFLFCASLPLPNVDAALEEAVYALDTLGADGIKLATNSRGQYLGDATLDPLMALLDARSAVVVLHPHKPVPVNDSLMSAAPLAMYEYPAETTRALVNMIVRNVPARFPHIKFVIPHCGSFLPLAQPRIEAINRGLAAAGMTGNIDWKANLRNFYYDLAGNPSPAVVDALLSVTTPDHLLYGSDYPYQPAGVLAQNLHSLRLRLAANERLAPYADDILRGNAMRLFSIDGDGGNGLADCKAGADTASTMCAKQPMQPDGIVRLSKIEVYPEHLKEYVKFATEVGVTSLRTEPGVITMYAVADKDNPCHITILETYASQAAYKSHIASKHFQKYKKGTLHMVKSLVLSEQTPLNPAGELVNRLRRE